MASCKVVRDDETGETTTIEQAGCGCNASPRYFLAGRHDLALSARITPGTFES